MTVVYSQTQRPLFVHSPALIEYLNVLLECIGFVILGTATSHSKQKRISWE